MDYGLHCKNSCFIDIILGVLKNTFKISALLKYTDMVKIFNVVYNGDLKHVCIVKRFPNLVN